MKKLILSAAVAFTVLATSNIYAQQGFGTNTPDRSSAVDIVSSKRGLLIPRIDLTKTTEAGPVAKPENALFVYNKATANDVTPGFYYWEAADVANAKEQGLGRWVRFVSSNSGNVVTVSAGNESVTVTSKTNGHDTDYEVSVKGGDTAGQVLVTKEVIVEGNKTYVTEWVNPQDFVTGVNGVTTEVVTDDKGKTKTTVGLGGDLTKATEINTKDGNTLAITGLEVLTKDNVVGHNIVVMGTDGILKNVSAKDLVEDAIDKGAINGKALTSKGNSIQIDGTAAATALLKDVNIEVKGGEKAGQILVTKEVKDGSGAIIGTITEWVDADKVGVEVTNGLKKITDGNTTKLGLGGELTEATTITTSNDYTLALKGLGNVTENPTTNNLVITDPTTGVLKQTSAKNLIEDAIEKGTDGTDALKAKTLKGDGITVTATGASDVTDNVANSLLKDVTLGIADNAITTNKINNGAVTQDKLYAGTKDADGNATLAAAGTVPVANADGTVTYKSVSTAIGQDLTTDGKIVIGDNKDSKLEKSVLVATKLSIKEGSISNVELGTGAVSADKMTSNTTDNGTETPAGKGQIPVADGNGGVTYQQVTGESLNGKALTSGSISVLGGEKALLDATKIEITGGTNKGDVLVTTDKPLLNEKNEEVKDKDGNTIYITEWVTPGDLGNTVTASNGLTKDGNDIQLGGKIDKGTTLAIAPETKNPDGTVTGGSLAIKGLNTADPKQGNKTVVVQANGQLATIDTAAGNVTINKEPDVTIGGDKSVVNNYHPSMSEIVIEVTLGATDTNLNLPAVNGTEGQTISVKIVNTDEEDHQGYLNIKSGSDVLAYGAMPFQGWIIKSNGTKWIVVGRN